MASASNSVTLWSNGGHGYTLNASFWEIQQAHLITPQISRVKQH